MVRKSSSSSSSAFLAMPLEIRLLVYQFCIPQNKCFDCSYDMYYQNRALEWDEPLWHLTENVGRYDPDELDGPPSDRHYVDDLEDSSGSDEKDRVSSDDEIGRMGDYCSYGSPSALPGILLLCRQIYDEVTAMLYGGNTFEVILHGDGQSDLARLFNPELRKKMRKILLVLRPMGVSYQPSFRMDPSVWTDVFDGLVILGIIAEQPEPPTSYQWPQIDPGEFEEWKTWLTSIMEYLTHAVPDTARIVVDANREEDTEDIIRRFMPERCQFQCLRAADFIFKRRPYSLESGYWDDDGPTSCRDIINDCDYDYYYSD